MSDHERPWLCPEPRCTPLLNLKDGGYKDITVPEPGESFFCWGVMERPVEFVYDSVVHPNDCNGCTYTPLKGLIRFQECDADWENLSTYYAIAVKRLRARPVVVEGPAQCPTKHGRTWNGGTANSMWPHGYISDYCSDCGTRLQGGER